LEDSRRRLDLLAKNPREDLDVELKDWLDLRQREHQADLAKAMLALANHGGGYVLVGYDDSTCAPTTAPAEVAALYDQDRVNPILQRYADPQVHAEVTRAEDADGNPHPVVIVPGGYTVPIRCQRSGPNGAHVRQNAIYIRRPGPESSEPQTAAEWAALMRRCVLADKEVLLDQVRSILTPVTAEASRDGATVPDQHRNWVEHAQQRFERLNEEAFGGMEQGPFTYGYWRAAYTVVPPVSGLSLTDLRERYSKVVGNETGWPVGCEMHRDDTRPYPYEGCVELWLAEEFSDPAVCDYWRVCPNGSFVLFRGYQDDSTEWEGRANPGTEVDFLTPIWRVGEFLLHGQRFVEVFGGEDAGLQVSMTWTGLAGRTLRNPRPARYLGIHGRSSQQNQVASSLNIQDARRVGAALPELVEELTRPLYEVFDFFSVPPQTIRTELGEMRR
jgi:Putative DNA-binding domain